VEIARRDELAVGEDMEADPDHDQARHHAEQAFVDLEAREQATERAHGRKMMLPWRRRLGAALTDANAIPGWKVCPPRPSSRDDRGGRRSQLRSNAKSQLHTATLPAGTPWQTSSFLIQPASITVLRLSLVIATGFRKVAFMVLPPGLFHCTVP